MEQYGLLNNAMTQVSILIVFRVLDPGYLDETIIRKIYSGTLEKGERERERERERESAKKTQSIA